MHSLEKLAGVIDAANEKIGRATAWLALAMVLLQFTVVVLRYIFGFGSIMMQEGITYLHAILFMFGAGYTLLHGGHVRVDIFYRDATPRTKAIVDMAGVILFLIPVSLLIIWATWPYIVTSWSVHEGSRETSGIQAVYLLKTVILVFAGLMIVQGLAMAARSWLVIKGLAASTPEQTEDLHGA